jgi:hypothetical protein
VTRQAGLALVVAAAALGSCRSRSSEDPSRVQPTYDERTGRLRQLAYDSNGDGRMDTWTYMDGARARRAEIDKDQDGRIERWEYYDERQQVLKVGISRLNDGREDAWMYPAPDGRIARLEVSTGRDGIIDRWEFYEKDVLTRVDADTDRNGHVDKWEEHRPPPDLRRRRRRDGRRIGPGRERPLHAARSAAATLTCNRFPRASRHLECRRSLDKGAAVCQTGTRRSQFLNS